MHTLVVPSLSTKFIKVAITICQFSQYLGTKLEMLFEIAKSAVQNGHSFRENSYFTPEM